MSAIFDDPGPHGIGRHMDHMLPEIPKGDFRKGSQKYLSVSLQWFSMTRQHAVMTMADSLYYSKFRDYCGLSMTLPSQSHMLDLGGIANWTLTYVDWSEGKWHPRTFMREHVTHELLKNLTPINAVSRVTSEGTGIVTWTQYMWNGIKRPCYLFGRKFHADTLDKLMDLFPKYTSGFD
ncbi:unnamed protein product [Eruca vesicaria subsp. sativa]|uniref:Uncharacterized protein n=1 Tax=Eruca vesicaria subsp. sativa TaxID=29727 RepID=A0ABC8KTL9_ERUVS|nr:unnamed protein product [Eruca vesicaria subsp. sativa]